ncbi:hypothetical protein EV368DRAFT_81401 [Lentinula lateritia]|uniref:Uncharacterized protein n=1 Tax=Lentinula aff. lateritia TaxID=2804960 RepID=A0ACC1TQL5_9AGAR|nr:hypothetical protein F5876DRAFT_80189 [Lentinula aff. lateritia]KAJ3853598.1 hypothetical protein EV368DRAFT_81401 [Lentinula lateritia]
MLTGVLSLGRSYKALAFRDARIHRLDIDCGTVTGWPPTHKPPIETDLSSTSKSEEGVLPFDSFLSAFKRIAVLHAPRGTGIRCLRFSNLDWTAYPLELQSSITTTLGLLFPTTTSLRLDQVVLHDIRQLNSNVLRAFPGLERLEARLKFLKYLDSSMQPRAVSRNDSKLPAGLKEVELADDGMATVLNCIAQSQTDFQDRLNVHHLSLEGCTPEMFPYVSATASVILDTIAGREIMLYVLDRLDPFYNDSSSSGYHYYSQTNLRTAGMALYVTANFVADTLLLYRCYVIWGSRKLVIAGPAVVSFLNTVAAAVATYYQRRDDFTVNILSANPSRIELLDSIDIGFLVINLVTNLLLTSLIAGRLRWTNMLTNRTLKGFSQSNEPHFNCMLETLVESCLLYPITLVVNIVLKVYTTTSDLDFLPIMIQILGIAPALIMVRVDLGISVELAAHDDSSKEIPSDVERGNLPGSFVNDSDLREEWRVTPWRGQAVSCDPHPKYACRDTPRDQALDRKDRLAHRSPPMHCLMDYPIPAKLSPVVLRPRI